MLNKGKKIIKNHIISIAKDFSLKREEILLHMIKKKNNELLFYAKIKNENVFFPLQEVLGYFNYEGLKMLYDDVNLFLINSFKENNIDLDKNFVVFKMNSDKLIMYIYDINEKKLVNTIIE